MKFRVWDKSINYMDDRVRVTTIDDYMKVEVLDAFSDWRELEEGQYKLMQSTGLKDKNGNEIYEGDILKTRTRGLVKVRFEDGNTVVTYKSGANTRTTLVLSNFLDKYQISIIGNIYEDGELLDEQ